MSGEHTLKIKLVLTGLLVRDGFRACAPQVTHTGACRSSDYNIRRGTTKADIIQIISS